MGNLNLLADRRVRIFIGHFGSGKTEVAVNYTLAMRQQLGQDSPLSVGIADLDVVNPYFRSREKHSLFAEKGIRVVGSSVDAPLVDVPAVSAEVNAFLEDDRWLAVLDSGGDPEGARVLGRFSGKLRPGDYDMFLVLNARRPETRGAGQVLRLMERLEAVSRLKVTGIINNTHMLKSTGPEDLLEGDRLAREVASETGLTIRYTTVMSEVASVCPDSLKGTIFPLNLYMRDDWMS